MMKNELLLKDIINEKSVIKTRYNFGFKTKGSLEQDLFIELIIEKLALKQNGRLIDDLPKIAENIAEKLSQNALNIPFSIKSLNDDMVGNKQTGTASALLYLKNELIGVVSIKVTRYDRFFDCAIFNENKTDFENELNKLIDAIMIRSFIDNLFLKSSLSRLRYFSKKDFQENPTSFIEKNSYFCFPKK